MSRSLGQNAIRKALHRALSPEEEGAEAQRNGLPISTNPYMPGGRGKHHAWLRGCARAAMQRKRK